jgi:hypothetical protein
MEEDNKISRRKAVAGLGAASLAVLTMSPAWAGQGDKPKGTTNSGPEDPINKYPKPPFKSQSQPGRA